MKRWVDGRPRIACSKGIHAWTSKDEAAKCCNGFVRMRAPLAYGNPKKSRELWYQENPKGWYQTILVPVWDTSEQAKLQAIWSKDQLLDFDCDELVEN